MLPNKKFIIVFSLFCSFHLFSMDNKETLEQSVNQYRKEQLELKQEIASLRKLIIEQHKQMVAISVMNSNSNSKAELSLKIIGFRDKNGNSLSKTTSDLIRFLEGISNF